MNQEQLGQAEYALGIPPLILKYLKEEPLTSSENNDLEEWKAKDDFNRWYFEYLMTNGMPPIQEFQRYLEYDSEAEQIAEESYQRLIAESNLPHTAAPIRWWYSWKPLTTAAVLVIMAGIALYNFFSGPKKGSIVVEKTQYDTVYKNDISPGSYKAKLTLADGRNIVLDSTINGELAQQGNTIIMKSDGELVYKASEASANKLFYNTLTTAKGESFATILSDGTKIWLNAGSSITYPATFTSVVRQVAITGEAYFEVGKDATKPFIVNITDRFGNEKGKAEVLGTRFNISAYDDDTSIKTTLVEGRLKMRNNDDSLILKPGQQSVIIAEKLKVINDVDTLKVTAWKGEDFYFKGDDIKSIMRQLERWYNIVVDYEGKISDETFSGRISRNKNLKEVLAILENGKVHFKIEDRKLTVLP